MAPWGALLLATVAFSRASLSVDEALAQGIPLVFSKATALQALRERFDAAASAPGAPLGAHLHALRQLAARAGGSAAEVGARGAGSGWALLMGLVEAAEADGGGGGGGGAPLPLLRSGGWPGAPRDPLPALLAPLGRGLGVDAAPLAGGALPPRVGLLLLDGGRCFGALARDLDAAAPLAARFLVVAATEEAGLVSEAVIAGRELGAEAAALGLGGRQLEAAAGLKGALFDFMARAGGDWSLAAHFPNGGGLTVLQRREG